MIAAGKLGRLAGSVLAVTLLVTAGGAQAQLDPTQETGSRIYTQPRQVEDPAQVGRFGKAVARCTYTRIGAQPVDALLKASDPATLGTQASGVDWPRLQNALENCMGDRAADWNADVRLSRLAMSFSGTRLRALLMEEAYLDRQQAAPVLTAGEGEAANRTYVSTGDALGVAQGLGAFTDCVVFRDAAGADALLRTEPGSPEERAAARALAPTLGACLVQGQDIAFTPASIRAMAADGLWSRVALGSRGAQ